MPYFAAAAVYGDEQNGSNHIPNKTRNPRIGEGPTGCSGSRNRAGRYAARPCAANAAMAERAVLTEFLENPAQWRGKKSKMR